MAEEATTAPETTSAEPETQTESLLQSGGDAGAEPPVTEAAETTQTETKDEKPAVPEKYEFVAPEGTKLDAAAIEAFTPLAKELGLSNEQAQKLVDFQAGQAKSQADAWVKQQSDWAESFKSDKEFGGQNSEASLRAANTALGKFFTKDEVTEIHSYGLANAPFLVKGLARIGKLMAEDKHVTGGPSAPESDPAKVMFPSMN